jgi:hypothetical protein
MVRENRASFVVISEVEGGEPEDSTWTRVVAVECDEQSARKHLPADLVEWPTDPASVLAMRLNTEWNSIVTFRIERWVSTQREIVCKMVRQKHLDEILSR